MKQLILMRHAEAQSPLGSPNDFSRTLTEKGVSDASKAAKFLFDQELAIDRLIFSAAVRTTSTAQLVSEVNQIDTPDMESNDDLYNAPIGSVLDFILKMNDNWNTVMLVGHNPTFSYLAEYLSDDTFIDLSPSHLVYIEFPIESWTMITQGLGSLVWKYTG